MLSQAFDSLFSSLTGIIPVTFLRVLSYNESSLNPNSVTPSSHATGLFQVVQKVLTDYNMKHGSKYVLEDTKNPELNSKIGIELLTHIVTGYEKNHPKSLRMDWTSHRYVSLVVQGFNAGYSEAGGVGFVVRKLEKAGVEPERITSDTVAEAAKKSGASRFLYDPKRVSYAKAVTRAYFKELNDEKMLKEKQLKEGSFKDKLLATTKPINVIDYLQVKPSQDLVTIKTSMGNMIVILLLPLSAGFYYLSTRRKNGSQRHY